MRNRSIHKSLLPDHRNTTEVETARAPDDGIAAVAGSPHDRIAVDRSPDDGVCVRGAPHDRVAGVARAPHDGVAVGRAEQVHTPRAVAVRTATHRAPDDV